jgi:hypothetical protein
MKGRYNDNTSSKTISKLELFIQFHINNLNFYKITHNFKIKIVCVCVCVCVYQVEILELKKYNKRNKNPIIGTQIYLRWQKNQQS